MTQGVMQGSMIKVAQIASKPDKCRMHAGSHPG
jgi:hypothetical protein